MGPEVRAFEWVDTIRKWHSRGRLLAASGMGPSLSAFLYNYTALPVLGYKSQLIFLPADLAKQERFLLHHLWHMPPNSFEHKTFFHMPELGAPMLNSSSCMALSSMFRAAHTTIRGWEAQLRSLEDASLTIFQYKNGPGMF